MRQRPVRLDPAGLRQVDPLVGEVDLELAVAGQLQREADRERAPLAGLALQVDVAAEELGQLADDREAEAGPLVLAGQDAVPLARARRPGGTSRRSSRGLPRRSRSRCRRPRATTNRPSARARSVTRPPSGVNLIALESRL